MVTIVIPMWVAWGAGGLMVAAGLIAFGAWLAGQVALRGMWR